MLLSVMFLLAIACGSQKITASRTKPQDFVPGALQCNPLHLAGKVVGKACVLAEGDAKDRTDILYLEPLPLFFK